MKISLSSLSLAVPLFVGASIGVASSAQAALIVGDAQFVGVQDVAFNRVQLDFGSNGIGIDGDLNVTSATGDFAGVTAGFIKDLVSPVPLPNLITVGPFAAPVASFLSFVGTPITFDLQTVTRNLSPGAITFVLEGTLKANGLVGKDDTPFSFSILTSNPSGFPTNLSQANLNAFFGTGNPGKDGVASFSGVVTGSNRVPEPMTILGSTAAIASIAAMKRKKRAEKLATASV
jgi:hypothetical protein